MAIEAAAHSGVPTSLAEAEERYPPRDLPAGAEVTRVAPSPTGRPHIGTAMQVILNRAVAKGTGGRFLLRVEDTDRARLDERSLEEIFGLLDWLDEPPDEGPREGGAYGPYVQSERLPLYRAAADHLLATGGGYRCFCSKERLDEVRERQRAAGEPTKYDRHCLALPPEEAARRAEAGEPHVIRLRVPDRPVVEVQDLARGPIQFDPATLDDSVLLKADGFPTYHLAVVVDDHFMRVTTVVRGEEWISSTPKHVLIYEAFGWTPVRFVHTPVLRDTRKRKLSKRSGDISVLGYFDRQGYLPPAFRNFITRVLWPHPDELDAYPHEDFVRAFDPAKMNVSGPVVDMRLLEHIAVHYTRELSRLELFDRVSGWLARLLAVDEPVEIMTPLKGDELQTTPVERDEVVRFRDAFQRDAAYTMGALGVEPERFHKLGDVLLGGRLFFPETFTPAGAEELAQPLGSPEAARELLERYRGVFRAGQSLAAWEGWLRDYATELGVKPGAVFLTLRVAVTGARRSPPLHPVMEVLGEAEVERRLELALATLA
jgi:glutamyl-tRNA synthetase